MGKFRQQTLLTAMIMFENQSKQVVKVRLLYYGINKCEPTEPFLTINRTS